MKGYPLENLLRIRRLKIDEAQAEVLRLGRAVEEAENRVLKKETELKEYKIWRLHREQVIYEEIKKKPFQSGNLSNTENRYPNSESRKLPYVRMSWMLRVHLKKSKRLWQQPQSI